MKPPTITLNIIKLTMQQNNSTQLRLNRRNWLIMKFIYNLGISPYDVTLKMYYDIAKWMPKFTKDNVHNIIHNAEIMSYYKSISMGRSTQKHAHFSILCFGFVEDAECGIIEYANNGYVVKYKIDEVWSDFVNISGEKILYPSPIVYYGNKEHTGIGGVVSRHYISYIDKVCCEMDRYIFMSEECDFGMYRIDVEIGEQYNVHTRRSRILYIMIETQKDITQHVIFDEYHRFVLDVLIILGLPFDMPTFRALCDFLPENPNDEMMCTIKENAKILNRCCISIGKIVCNTFVIPSDFTSLNNNGCLYHISHDYRPDLIFDITSKNNKMIPAEYSNAQSNNKVSIDDVVLYYGRKDGNISKFSNYYADIIKSIHSNIECKQYGAKNFSPMVDLKNGEINLRTLGLRHTSKYIFMYVPNVSP